MSVASTSINDRKTRPKFPIWLATGFLSVFFPVPMCYPFLKSSHVFSRSPISHASPGCIRLRCQSPCLRRYFSVTRERECRTRFLPAVLHVGHCVMIILPYRWFRIFKCYLTLYLQLKCQNAFLAFWHKAHYYSIDFIPMLTIFIHVMYLHQKYYRLSYI